MLQRRTHITRFSTGYEERNAKKQLPAVIDYLIQNHAHEFKTYLEGYFVYHKNVLVDGHYQIIAESVRRADMINRLLFIMAVIEK